MQRRDRKGLSASSLAERRAYLNSLQAQRNDVLAQLNALLEQQVCSASASLHALA